MPCENMEQRRQLVSDKVEALLGSTPDSFVNPFTVLASPAWRGVESDVWLAKSNQTSVIFKHYHADTDFYVDQASAFDAAQEAGRIHVGPEILSQWPDHNLIAMEELGAPWVAGGLHHGFDHDIRANIISQKKIFQANARLEKNTSIFDEIKSLYAITRSDHITTHNDILPFMDFALNAETKINALGYDLTPCHRDGNSANLMVHNDKSVKLIDFDLAANCDPFEDIGAHLVEFFENDIDARAGFEQWYGSFDEGLFQRAMIYGLLDDLRWGLIGSIMGARSPRTSLEFTKYAAWRFIRLEMQAKRSDADDRVRNAA